MAAPLNARQFYHGTAADLGPGDELRPGSETGNLVHSPSQVADPEGDATRVFSTDDERDAWSFAVSAGSPAELGELPRRPRVYEVEPQGNVGGNYQDGMLHSQWETTSDRARVMRRIDAPPPNTHFFDDSSTGPATQPALPGEEFTHGFMRSDEEMRMSWAPGPDGTPKPPVDPSAGKFAQGEAERSYRREGHAELFDSGQFDDRGEHMRDKMYRSRW